ncbi:MAG TPA: VWA domain-containing protein [Roseiflexaceae bacterium]|nr:VWA domain-containing protein [Roseiflexaceae bacterium]
MRSLLAMVALLVAGAWLLVPAPVAAEEPPARVTQVDASRYPEITVYVRVADGAGQPLGGLDADDFQITEGGIPVEITAFAGGGASPVAAALLIDRSASMDEFGKLEGARQAALAFVRQMRPGDRTALIAFSSFHETYQPFTGDTGDLEAAVRRLRPAGGTALYDSLVAGVDALRSVQGRRALLLLTDGQDCRDDPDCPDEYGSTHSLAQAIRHAAEAGQPVYAIGLGERGGYGRAGVDEEVLRRIAEETGGEYFYAPDAARLADLYRRLSAGIQQEYALTYRSPRPFYDGTRRDIRVTVGGAPAARAGYLQQHLINVRSNPVIGLILLAPILWALVLPTVLMRRRSAQQATHPALSPSSSLLGPPSSALSIGPVADGATLLQPPVESAARRAFCVECGTPLRVGARFCAACGAAITDKVTS